MGAKSTAAAAVAGSLILWRCAQDKDENSVIDKIKIVDVIRFVINMFRNLASPDRLARDKRHYVNRLLYVVLCPQKWEDGKSKLTASARSLIGWLFALAVVRTWLMNRSSNFVRTVSRVVYRRNRETFMRLMFEGGLMVAGGAAVSALHNYSHNALSVTFRHRLTEVIHHKYFQNMAYYHIPNLQGKAAIADADFRTSREVWSVAHRLSSLMMLLTSSIPPILTFTAKLWMAKGFKFAMLPHFYLLLAYEIAQRMFPKNIGELYRKQTIQNSYFTKATSRVQTHSESIAALGGAPLEQKILERMFKGVVLAGKDIHFTKSKFDLIFKMAYINLCRPLMAAGVMYPLVTKGGKSSAADDLSQVSHTLHIMTEMLVANGNILNLHATANHMFGLCKRICVLLDTLDDVSAAHAKTKGVSMSEGSDIAFENVDVHTPSGHLLVKDLSFKVTEGDSLLLTGHNGAGKSSIFRCLGGLWKIPQGNISKPGAESTGLHKDIFYLPQKPYNTIGTLRDQITYPVSSADVKVSNEELNALLAKVNLTHLANMEVGEGMNWEDKLSLGEQQRLAMARLFYHKPKFAILDECTSAVSQEMEELLYDECVAMGISYITICHRPALKQYHNTNLHLTGKDAGWKLSQIEHPKGERRKRRLSAEQMAQVVDTENRKSTNHVVARLPVRSSLSKLAMIVRLMLPGSMTKLSALFGLIALRTACHEVYSFAMSSLVKSMIARDASLFLKLSVFNAFQDVVAALVEEAVTYTQNNVSVTWHDNLASHALEKLFSVNAFYRMRNLDKRIPDADQRITQEVQELAGHCSSILANAITPLIDIVWFTWRLQSIVGATGMKSFYGYVGLCYVTMKLAMPSYATLEKEEKELESRFGYIHSRLRTHAESVGFFGGDSREQEIANASLDNLVVAMRTRRRADAGYKLVKLLCSKEYDEPSSALSCPDLVNLKMQLDYASASPASDGSLAFNSQYVQSAALRALRAFGKLSSIQDSVVKLFASSTRVCELFDVIDELKASHKPIVDGTDGNITMDSVNIVTPSGNTLANNLTVSVSPSKSLLVTGPNGSGKTSFFRVVAGLWPSKSGSLSVPRSKIMLVPQKPYSVLGSLADQVTYPKYFPAKKRPENVKNKIHEVLGQVGIAYLIEREGLDSTKLWEDTLSLGEQQRMGIARLLFHGPQYGVLDECTDAVSMDVEESLYRSMYESNVTAITISKRLTLAEFHSQELRLGVTTNEKQWELRNLE